MSGPQLVAIVPAGTFGHALEAMKAGMRIARKGWNGAGMWVAMAGSKTPVKAEHFWSHHNAQFAIKNGGSAVVEPYFTIKNAQDEIAVWVPSTSDCLANDWLVLA